MSREKDDAYDMVDKFLRNNLDDADYAEYLEALELLYTPEQTQDEEPVAWTCQDELNALGTDVTCYMYAEPLVGETNIPLYLHPAPRKQDDEPVARLHITETDTYPVIDVEVLNGEMLQPSMFPINVYTIQQKPFVRLSEEEIDEGFEGWMGQEEWRGFRSGVRFCEKHHGIGGGDE